MGVKESVQTRQRNIARDAANHQGFLVKYHLGHEQTALQLGAVALVPQHKVVIEMPSRGIDNGLEDVCRDIIATGFAKRMTMNIEDEIPVHVFAVFVRVLAETVNEQVDIIINRHLGFQGRACRSGGIDRVASHVHIARQITQNRAQSLRRFLIDSIDKHRDMINILEKLHLLFLVSYELVDRRLVLLEPSGNTLQLQLFGAAIVVVDHHDERRYDGEHRYQKTEDAYSCFYFHNVL